MDDNQYPPEGDNQPYLSLERQLSLGPHTYQLTASGAGDERIGLTLVGWNAAGEVVSEISGGISPTDLAPVAEALTSTLAGLATLRRQRLTAAAPGPAPAPALAAVLAPAPAAALGWTAAPGWPAPSGSPATPGWPAVPGSGAAVVTGSAPAAAAGPGSAARNAGPVPAAPAKRHPNQGVRWSAEDDDRLAARYQAGATPKELMAEFGRSRGGITARLEHLGLVTPDGAPVARPRSGPPARATSSPERDTSSPEPDGSALERDGSALERDTSGLERGGSGLERDGSGLERDTGPVGNDEGVTAEPE
jgi:hypothetical protein